GCSAGPLDPKKRKRPQIKQSIYSALNTLKTHSHSHPHSHTLADMRRQPHSPEPASLPLGEYTFYPTDADSAANDDLRVNHVSRTTFPSLIISHRPHSD